MKKRTLLIIAGISFIIFLLILINLNNLQFADNSVNLLINKIQNPFLVNTALIIGVLLEPINMIVLCLILSIILFYQGYKKESFVFSIISLISGILIYSLKEIIQRTRPENIIEKGFSFPSGHALISIVFFGFFIYFFKNKKIGKVIGLLLSFFILVICFSRIYLGVHWITDVLGGFFLGLIILLAGISFLKN